MRCAILGLAAAIAGFALFGVGGTEGILLALLCIPLVIGVFHSRPAKKS